MHVTGRNAGGRNSLCRPPKDSQELARHRLPSSCPPAPSSREGVLALLGLVAQLVRAHASHA